MFALGNSELITYTNGMVCVKPTENSYHLCVISSIKHF